VKGARQPCEAGNPFRHSRETEPLAEPFDRYTAYLDAHPERVDAVTKAARQSPSVLICFERSAADCHRSVLAERVAKQLGSGPVRAI
jgi:hypothetical protein